MTHDKFLISNARFLASGIIGFTLATTHAPNGTI